MLVARFAPWTDAGRAWLILAAFGVTFTIFYYRFDDFHVTTQILQGLLPLAAAAAAPPTHQPARAHIRYSARSAGGALRWQIA